MNWLRRLGQNRLWDVAVAGLAVGVLAWLVISLPASATRNDFAHYYLSSRLLVTGHSAYTTELEPLYAAAGFEFHQDVPAATNPPGLLWLFAPVALLPARAAFWSWVAVQGIAVAVILGLTRKWLGGRGWFFLCAGTVSSAAVYWHFLFSQVQLVLAALVLVAFVGRQVGRGIPACLLVAGAGLIKLYPFVLLPWFIWGQDGSVRARWQRGLVTALACGVGVWLTGVERWSDFFRHGMTIVVDAAWNHTFNFTVPALITNLGWAATTGKPPTAVPREWWTVGVSAGLALIALAYWRCWRARSDAASQFSLLCVAMLAGSVTSWGHYFVFLIFPIAVIAVRLRAVPTPGRIGWFVVALMLVNCMATVTSPFLEQQIVLKVLANNLPLAALLILGGLLWRDPA